MTAPLTTVRPRPSQPPSCARCSQPLALLDRRELPVTLVYSFRCPSCGDLWTLSRPKLRRARPR